jgi:tRNA threonylcarbamoyladenosine biosynthesis protein TsaE
MTQRVTRSAEETVEIGRAFSARLQAGDVVALLGELGSGKTQFVTGVCEGLETSGHVGSPTFTIIHEYPAEHITVVHADLYRIPTRAAVAETGLVEYFRPPFVCLIEWAERILDLLPPGSHVVTFAHTGAEQERRIEIRRTGEPAA